MLRLLQRDSVLENTLYGKNRLTSECQSVCVPRQKQDTCSDVAHVRLYMWIVVSQTWLHTGIALFT